MSNKISLQSAILMNINIMAGAGIFINIFDLTDKLSVFSGILYGIIGCFIFPLTFTFAHLVEKYPDGGFYTYGKQLHPFLGFVACWGYFFAKLASVTLYMHVVSIFLKHLFPLFFEPISTFIISLNLLSFYIFLNCLNMKTGLIIQKIFVIAKMIPLISLIMLGIYTFDINILTSLKHEFPAHNFILMIPIALYCFLGFEAACSISKRIENPSKNAPKAIFYSFFIAILIYVLFQSLMSFALYTNIHNLNSYTDSYRYLLHLLPFNEFIQKKLVTIISFLIGFSAMGASYSILFANSWNIYTLAENKHIIGSTKLVKLNKYSIPYIAVITEGIICTLLLLTTGGNKIPLQQIATLGSTITYTISTIAFLYSIKKYRFWGWLSLITCSGLITSCVISTMKYNLSSLYLLIFIFIFGISMFVYKEHFINKAQKLT